MDAVNGMRQPFLPPGPFRGPLEPHNHPPQPGYIGPCDICQTTREVMHFAAGHVHETLQQKVLKLGESFDPQATLLRAVEKILPPLVPGAVRGPKRLRDAEYIRISDWCRSNGFIEWGKRPRTFVVLHMIGCIEVLDGFIKEGLSDIALPYTAENLPSALTGLKRAEFLDFQKHVLTSHAKNLERSGRLHQNVEGDAESFFWLGKKLGSGGFGIVDEVYGRLSLKSFARKRISRGRSFNTDQKKLLAFENELSNLKQLSHRHLVKLVSSYTDKTFVGFLMTPVADMDLATYLASNEIDYIDKKNCLREFFGCLATAVEYLHKEKVRHKDIKPKNILVHNKQVLLADFGTSHSWADDGASTSQGTNRQGITRAYCAPEVANYGVCIAFGSSISCSQDQSLEIPPAIYGH